MTDLHLGAGAGTCVESFYLDHAVAGFLDHLHERAGQNGRPLVALGGDLVDFFLGASLVTNPDGCPVSEAIALTIFNRVL